MEHQGAFDAASLKKVYPKTKPTPVTQAEALEDQEVTGDRGTPEPGAAEKRRKAGIAWVNHPKSQTEG